jgi:hypothetical protein
MKNLVCPVSQEKVQEHLPRVTAFFTIAILTAYLISGYLPLILFLFLDFFIRGINKSRYSLLFQLARITSKIFSFKSHAIDKAPKLFAARIGAVLTATAIVFHAIGILPVADGIAITIILFAFLECVLNLCVACYIYTFLIFPLYYR